MLECLDTSYDYYYEAHAVLYSAAYVTALTHDSIHTHTQVNGFGDSHRLRALKATELPVFHS